MFKGIKVSGKSNNNAQMGIEEAVVLGINPDADQLTAIIGDASKWNTTYEKKPTMYSDGKDVQAVSFWIANKEGTIRPIIKTINLVNEVVMSKDETKTQYMTITRGSASNGDYMIFGQRYLSSEEQGQEVKAGATLNLTSGAGKDYTLEVLSEARTGEARYYDLLHKVLGWKEDDKFMEQLVAESIDFDSVYNGDFSGLQNLVQYLGENDSTFVTLFTAKLTANGVRQDVELKDSTTYSTLGGVTDWHVDKFKEALRQQTNSGYDISNNEYVLEKGLVDYVEIEEEENPFNV
jgi:hypothetical protein